MTDESGPGDKPNGINTYNEKALHAALKQWYAGPGDQLEVKLDGYFIDLVHGDQLVEIQTRNFGAIKKKLRDLCERHPVRLVFPVAVEKWIRFMPKDDQTAERRRKSPRRDSVEYLFRELVYLPALLAHENFSIEVLLIHEEEVRRYTGKRSFRRKGWVTEERRLIEVVDRRVFQTPAELAALLPPGLPQPFTLKELAKESRQPEWLARKMVYCLKALGAVEPAGRRGRALLYTRANSPLP